MDEVLHQVNEQYNGAAGNIDGEIDDKFNESADDVREANKNGASLLKSALYFPIGLSMRQEHVMDDGTKYDVNDIAYWDENVTLGVDMPPDYLRHDKFYDPEQDIWIDSVKIGDQYIADPAQNPSSKTFIPFH